MILIIAEKPSLARNIVAGIGKMNKHNGYFEGSGYIVTWAFGHLFSLYDIEDYTKNTDSVKWTLENLPCFPKNFEFKLKRNKDKSIDKGVENQFNIISGLCNRKDVEKIVNAGDSDREGEIIIRICLNHALKENKPLYRLWLPDQTVQTVSKALSELKPESEYDNLAKEGLARTYIDWLYGVNLTRYATLKTGTLLRVGRVIVPIVKAIYDRDLSINNFKPEKYYVACSNEVTNGESIELTSKIKFKKDELYKAKKLCEKYNLTGATVVDKKTKKDVLKPGKLYSLSKLQNFLGKKYKMPMDESLKLVQKLYENGYLTYPRTNSEYLATAEKDKIKQIINNVSSLGYKIKFKDNKSIFDDKKIESHSALTPTYKIPKKENLTEKEMLVYSTVLRRFVAVFCSEDCIVEKFKLKIKVGDLEEFNLNGNIVVQKGWTFYDNYTQKNKILPNLSVGDTVNVNFTPKEKETTPPKHYTIETLNNYLKNPFKEEKASVLDENSENDEDEYKAIFEGLELGTEATRTGIIDNAIKSKYIELKKDVYKILPDGIYLIESLSLMNISMDKYKTSTLGQSLKKVFHGEIEIEDSVNLVKEEISNVFKTTEQPIEKDINTGFYGDYIGVCPLCGGEVKKGKYGYGCMEYKNGCKFRINSTICKRAISVSNAKKLLETGTTSKIEGFISKNGKSFDAVLKLKDGSIVFDFN